MRYFKIYFIHGMCNIVKKKPFTFSVMHCSIFSYTAVRGKLAEEGRLEIYKAPARGSIERLIQGQQVHNGNYYLQLYYGEV